MPPISDKVRIQNALVAAAMAGTFYSVVYDPTTKVVSLGATTAPGEALANEIAATFGPSINHRKLVRERTSWTFDLILRFNTEVSLEAFENALLDPPIRLAPDPAQIERRGQMQLDLIGSTVHHPVQQQGSAGTNVTYVFQARKTPN